MVDAKQKPDKGEPLDLPPPGPVNLISDTGFGPVGTFDEEPPIRGGSPVSWLLDMLFRRRHPEQAENLKVNP